ncbi:hypothetical protein C0J52_14849 [Blattella germanica]|nr:hypothetical protein C0J52_14849 [Blattella germanica]
MQSVVIYLLTSYVNVKLDLKVMEKWNVKTLMSVKTKTPVELMHDVKTFLEITPAAV